MAAYTGKDIINLGIKPGPHIPAMIELANSLGRLSLADMGHLAPPAELSLHGFGKFTLLAEAFNDDEQANLNAVCATMAEMARTPVVKAAAAMPDACPAGELGTIPVGGVAASEGIHPGMHSADICCSVAISIFDSVNPAHLLDAVNAVTHFGPGGRDDFTPSPALVERIRGNALTKDLVEIAVRDMGTQGDGNHFAFVGQLKSTGQTALVTHHGSRGFGARLYKIGMRIAERYRRELSPKTLKQNAWIPADTKDGDEYWDALQIVREWTKENHFSIHAAANGTAVDRFWNEHNFVFRKSDGLFYHGKGATPAFDGWAPDATDLTLIPLNMAQPVLIVRGKDNPDALGFSPHGAGRNFSRAEHRRRRLGDLEAETAGIDARFFSGIADPTELPSGYKNADEVRRQITAFQLAEVVDEVIPHGCIMAGDWEQNAPWRKKATALTTQATRTPAPQTQAPRNTT